MWSGRRSGASGDVDNVVALGVLVDVAYERDQVSVTVNAQPPEAVLEERAGALVAAIDGFSVADEEAAELFGGGGGVARAS